MRTGTVLRYLFPSFQPQGRSFLLHGSPSGCFVCYTVTMLFLKKTLLLTGALAALSALHSVAADTRPNIVFFLSDDQPLRAMSHVDPWFYTPNMDRLASEGIVFENGFVESSVCAVSRASIMLGQQNARHLIQSFDVPISAEQMEKSFPVLLLSLIHI